MIATAGLLAITARGMAQSSLTDYANGTVDMGMGITQSQKLSTAATQTISGEQGRRSIILTCFFDSQYLVSCVLVPTAKFPLASNANLLVPCFEHHQRHFS